MYFKYFKLQLVVALWLYCKHYISTEENIYLRITLNFVDRELIESS